VTPAATRTLKRRLRNGLRRVAQDLVNQAKVRASEHVNTGALRSSITWSDGPGLTVLFGIRLAGAPHARYLEYGFKPHFVPEKYIGDWAKRVLGIRSGLFVGGRNTHLEHGCGLSPSGGYSKPSELLAPGTVGFSVLRWTVKNTPKRRLLRAFKTGYMRQGGR